MPFQDDGYSKEATDERDGTSWPILDTFMTSTFQIRAHEQIAQLSPYFFGTNTPMYIPKVSG